MNGHAANKGVAPVIKLSTETKQRDIFDVAYFIHQD